MAVGPRDPAAHGSSRGSGCDDGEGGVRLTILGCDGSWPGPGGACSSYLVQSGSTSLLVDAGPGSFATLQLVCDPATLTGVFLSHHHPDHWTDLQGLATHARYGGTSPRSPLPVFAPPGLAERSELADWPVLAWTAVTDGGSARVGELACRFHRTDHSGETLAVRIDGGGRALGYSADTGPGWELATLGPDLDLALCEATYTHHHEGRLRHLSGRQAGEQARRAGARRLVVTHRWPTVDAGTLVAEAEAAFGAPVEYAVNGKEFHL
jgi:ribonuclease BN (tRNA processing enzyme)